jgi:hypothetical protein
MLALEITSTVSLEHTDASYTFLLGSRKNVTGSMNLASTSEMAGSTTAAKPMLSNERQSPVLKDTQ